MPNTPAFVIGVTGHMDLPAADLPEIRDRFRQIFAWLRREKKAFPDDLPDWFPVTETGAGDQSPLAGLDLGEHRIVLLTSLAPGIDTIAAEEALKHGIEVRAPLPFPAEIYPEASTFTEAPDPESAKATFQKLKGEVDHFPVLLNGDIDLDAGALVDQFRKDATSEDSEGRHMRYRASGEYVGTHSHLLIAFFQPDKVSERSEVGSQKVLEVTRTGPTAGVLPDANHFPWNDAVPVVYVPCRSVKRVTREVGEQNLNQELSNESWKKVKGLFLPPLWVKGCELEEGRAASLNPSDCERYGFEILHRVVGLFREYLDRSRRFSPSRAAQVNDLSLPLALLAYEEPQQRLLQSRLSERGIAFLKRLSSIAEEQSRGSGFASKLTQRRRTAMRRLAIFTFFAAFSFHGFSHWYFADKKVAAAQTHALKGEGMKDSAEGGTEKKAAETALILGSKDGGGKGPDIASNDTTKNEKFKKWEKKFALAFLFAALGFIGAAALVWGLYQR
ncbi:MAG: hypothetical protein AAGC68_02910, partial [Verrucomicrobiota bacterium]